MNIIDIHPWYDLIIINISTYVGNRPVSYQQYIMHSMEG